MNIPHIENAFSNIKAACNSKLSLLYPTGIPEAVQHRYEQELSFLKNSKWLDDFELFRLMSIEAKKSSTIISMRGTITGSFIYYLLGNNCFNPLPVYYYCPECGYFEQVQTHLFGIDLPQKNCPACGKPVFADGFNITSESVWGIDGKKIIDFDYNVNAEFLPFARRVLTSLYPDNEVVPWGMFQMAPYNSPFYSEPQTIGVELIGYAVLPGSNTVQDYSDLISYLENGDLCVTGSGWDLENSLIKPVRLHSLDYLDYLLSLQRTIGIYANEITTHDLRDITWSNIYNTTILNPTESSFFHALKPKTYRDMAAIESSSHSTFSWQELDQKDFSKYKQMISSDAFKKYPCFTRDDFFDYLVDSGIERELAFDVSERIWKGRSNSPRHKEEFNSLPIPEEIKEVARNYMYVFPRSHCVEYVLIFARLAYYAKIDSRAFSKIVFKKK